MRYKQWLTGMVNASSWEEVTYGHTHLQVFVIGAYWYYSIMICLKVIREGFRTIIRLQSIRTIWQPPSLCVNAGHFGHFVVVFFFFLVATTTIQGCQNESRFNPLTSSLKNLRVCYLNINRMYHRELFFLFNLNAIKRSRDFDFAQSGNQWLLFLGCWRYSVQWSHHQSLAMRVTAVYQHYRVARLWVRCTKL